MSTSNARLTIALDVLTLPAQRALVLSTLAPAELVAAVLREFTDLEYLCDDPAAYELARADTGAPLREDEPLGAQIGDGARLRLREREVALPAGLSRPSRPIYLREMSGGAVFRLAWVPALIGRRDSRAASSEPIAVDLADYPTGQRVSRRHAAIVEQDGRFFVERLAANPLAVRSDGAALASVEDGRQPLGDGDVLLLEHSQIALKFLVRDPEGTP